MKREKELDRKQGRRLMKAFQDAAEAEGLTIADGTVVEVLPGVAQVQFVLAGRFERRAEDIASFSEAEVDDAS